MHDAYTRFWKPAIDRASAGVLLLALAPLFAVIAIAVKCSSRGPVFFAQDRVGHRERTFRMLKFRTMRIDADDGIARHEALLRKQGTLLKLDQDPRVTRIGKVLRRCSLDELPQLLNVLSGDMSIVGPRPLIAFMLDGHPKERRIRCQVRPGLTGRWQVEARDACTSLDDMWIYDRAYLERISFREDASLLLRTIPVVLSGKGAK
jgi:lipopolysaccharide/colanic/teichoic acid biosynthesis glycosyltransferase